jgi:hypothetical protein
MSQLARVRGLKLFGNSETEQDLSRNSRACVD